MSLGGSGIARHEGLVLFIPLSAPGDRLRVRIVEKKKNFAFAEIVEILQPSNHRINPKCPVFGRCGGCNWQHLSYSEQLHQKQSIVMEQLSRVVDPSTQILPISPSPRELRYRNRIQVHLKGKKWGYFARRSHDLVETEDCWIAEEGLISKLSEVTSSEQPQDQRRVQVTLHQNLQVTVDNDSTDGDDLGFSQVNRFQNENLVKTALDWAEGSWPEIWDLYAGAGNFTFPLSEKFKKAKMTAVELSSASVQAAQAHLRKANVSPQHLKFMLSDVGIFLRRAVLSSGSLIFLDPPRGGCEADVIRSLASQKFSKILYVSCNPATLARDLALLKSSSSRRVSIKRVQAFDMFPQTDHVEVLTELVIDDLPS